MKRNSIIYTSTIVIIILYFILICSNTAQAYNYKVPKIHEIGPEDYMNPPADESKSYAYNYGYWVGTHLSNNYSSLRDNFLITDYLNIDEAIGAIEDFQDDINPSPNDFEDDYIDYFYDELNGLRDALYTIEGGRRSGNSTNDPGLECTTLLATGDATDGDITFLSQNFDPTNRMASILHDLKPFATDDSGWSPESPGDPDGDDGSNFTFNVYIVDIPYYDEGSSHYNKYLFWGIPIIYEIPFANEKGLGFSGNGISYDDHFEVQEIGGWIQFMYRWMMMNCNDTNEVDTVWTNIRKCYSNASEQEFPNHFDRSATMWSDINSKILSIEYAGEYVYNSGTSDWEHEWYRNVTNVTNYWENINDNILWHTNHLHWLTDSETFGIDPFGTVHNPGTSSSTWKRHERAKYLINYSSEGNIDYDVILDITQDQHYQYQYNNICRDQLTGLPAANSGTYFTWIIETKEDCLPNVTWSPGYEDGESPCTFSNLDYWHKINSSHMFHKDISIESGWNLITIPTNNSITAKYLAEDIVGCVSVSKWDQYTQSYWAYFVGGPDSFDFELEPGYGYFVETTTSSNLSYIGKDIDNVSMEMKLAWDMIGWYSDFNITAVNLSENITGCVSISKWDPVAQSYWAYFVGGPSSFDFNISKGMGLFVEIDTESMWYGEESITTGGGKSGGGRSGSNNSSSPGLPHAIYGYAYYKNTSIPAINATIQITNTNTSEQINDTLQFNYSGWYNIDLNLFNISGWEHGNIIQVYINGTGNYSGWNGQTNITANNSTGGQLLASINCFNSTTPEINDITMTASTLGIGDTNTITTEVTDPVNEITSVMINITKPDTTTLNTSMVNTVNDTYQYIFNDTWTEGEYSFFIYAVNDVNNTNTSNSSSFTVDVTSTIQICTIYNEYSENVSLNLTDPPGGPAPIIGYDLLDDNTVLHIWNRYDDYYFNTSSGIQLTNHKDEYWSRNILMLGYYNNDEWNLVYRADELSGFSKSIDTDNTSYINITLWKNLEYNGYYFTLALRYHLGVNDNELTIIPYIQNIGNPIPYDLGFAWEVNDIQIDITSSGDYLLINNTEYMLNESLDHSWTDLNDTSFYIREDLPNDTSKSLYLRWNPDLNYKVHVKSRNNTYNAPVILGIKVGTLGHGQSKQTKLFWYDASEITYYFDQYSAFEGWANNPGYMVDSSTSTYATTTTGDVEHCTSNTCSRETDLGQISKVELRSYAVRVGGSWDMKLRPVFPAGDGDDHSYTLQTSAGWSSWFDITCDTNAPASWTWQNIDRLDCDVEMPNPSSFPSPVAYCSKVEVRVTYTPWTPSIITDPKPCDGCINVSIMPKVGITIRDINNDSHDITWYSNSSGSWQVFGRNNSVYNGTYQQDFNNATVNGQWWYWYVNVTDDHDYNQSNVFKFYTGTQSKIANTGETDLSGYLLIQIEYYTGTAWVVDQIVINDTTARTINASSELGLDSLFNGLLVIGDLNNGDGDYRVYSSFRDPGGNVLEVDSKEMDSWWKFEVDLI